MDYLISTIVNGIAYAMLLFMVSAGLTLVFGMMGVMNFAHASFYMLGAYTAFVVVPKAGFIVGLLAGALVVATVGAAVERVLLRRAHRFGHEIELLITFGLALIVEEVVKTSFGNFPVSYQAPSILREPIVSVSGVQIVGHKIVVIGIAISMLGLLFALLKFTRAGVVVRAATRLPQMVEMLGHNVSAVFTSVFAVGAGLAGLAGAVAGAYFPTSPTMALELGVVVFLVVAIGGLGSILGALQASLLIGVSTTAVAGLSVSLADVGTKLGLQASSPAGTAAIGGFMNTNISSIASVTPFALLFLVLSIRPEGLRGEKS